MRAPTPATRYVRDLRDARRLLDELPIGPRRSRMSTAIMRAAGGVLRHSAVEEQREEARDAIRALALGRSRKRVARAAAALVRGGATIDDVAIEAAAVELAELAAAQTIAEAEAGRLRLSKAPEEVAT